MVESETLLTGTGVQDEVILEEEVDEHLDARGSLANIADEDDDVLAPKKVKN